MSSYWSWLTSLFHLWLVSCVPSNLFLTFYSCFLHSDIALLFVCGEEVYPITLIILPLPPPSFTKLDEHDLVLSVSLFPPQTCWYFHYNFLVIQLDLWLWAPQLWLIHKWNQSEYSIWHFSHLCYKYRLPALKSPSVITHQPHATAVMI